MERNERSHDREKLVLGQASINLKLRQFSSSLTLERPLHSCLDFVLFFFLSLSHPHINFCFSQADRRSALSFENCPPLFSRCLKYSCASSKFLISDIISNIYTSELFRGFEISKLRYVAPRSSRFDVATPVVHVGGPMALLPVKIPLRGSKCSRLCSRHFFLFFSFFFSSAGAHTRQRPREDAGMLSRSTEVVSNRIPAQQAIVRSKEIALQKYTESAACKKSKKACLRGVCVDRSRLHFTVTDGRRTRRRRTRRRSLRWR